MPAQILPFPQELRPQLPTIVGNVDYLSLRRRLEEIDSLLHRSGLEGDFVQRSLEHWRTEDLREPTAVEQLKHQERSRRALRCTILRTLLQEDYRGFSCQLAGNPLYQWFCHIDAIDTVHVISKSELQRFTHWLPAAQMRRLIDGLLRGAVERPEQLQLQEELDLEEYFLDSTCLKANIHFPTDWVLLRDAVRTLMKATLLIRREGLRGRMRPPEEFLRSMNRLSIEMTQQARRSGGKKERKRVLRQMKKLVKVVRAHARHHAYVVGKTGSGKSTLLRNLILQHLYRGHGVGLIDPHGDLAEELLDNFPPWRADDLVYFNPSDLDFPVSLNLLANVPGDQRPLVASGLVEAFKSLRRDSWGPRMEYILFNALSALLDCQNVSLLGVNRMLTEPDYRAWVVRQIKDPFIRKFWAEEFAGYEPRFVREAIAPIQNKLGQFLLHPPIRNILGQVKRKVDFRFTMDRQRVFIANLSKGRLGADKANLLGSLLLRPPHGIRRHLTSLPRLLNAATVRAALTPTLVDPDQSSAVQHVAHESGNLARDFADFQVT